MLALYSPSLPAEIPALEKLLEPWHEYLDRAVSAGDISPTTRAAYKAGVGKFIAWLRGRSEVGVTPDVITSWKAALRDKGYKPAAINLWLSGVRALYSWAGVVGLLAVNPAGVVKGVKRSGTGKRHSRDILTDIEVRRLLALPDASPVGLRDKAILSLMVFCGVRSVEVVRAEVKDIHTLSGREVLDVTGKGHLEPDEYVILSGAVSEAVHDWLAVRGGHPGPLFTSYSNRSSGKGLSLRALRYIVKRYFAAAGIVGDGKTTHSLRHTAITKVIVKSGSIQKGQELGRHKNINTTMVYLHEITRLSNPAEDYVIYTD